MISAAIGGAILRTQITGVTYATPTESCLLALGKEWLFLSRLVTQLIRRGGLSFTIQLSTILSRLAFRNCDKDIGCTYNPALNSHRVERTDGHIAL